MTEERISKKIVDIKMESKQPRGRPRCRWIDQIRIEMREGKWEEIQENNKRDNRDGRRFLCSSQLIPLEMT